MLAPLLSCFFFFFFLSVESFAKSLDKAGASHSRLLRPVIKTSNGQIFQLRSRRKKLAPASTKTARKIIAGANVMIKIFGDFRQKMCFFPNKTNVMITIFGDFRQKWRFSD
jgi:hypothetical protein